MSVSCRLTSFLVLFDVSGRFDVKAENRNLSNGLVEIVNDIAVTISRCWKLKE